MSPALAGRFSTTAPPGKPPNRNLNEMRQKRNMFHTKEQDKTSEEQINEVEVGNLPEKDLRVMIVKMIQDLQKRMDAQSEKLQEVLNKELENIKHNHTELKNTITEMRNILE